MCFTTDSSKDGKGNKKLSETLSLVFGDGAVHEQEHEQVEAVMNRRAGDEIR